MSGTITSFAAVIVVKALGLLESIVVARILGDIQYGLLALVLSATNLVLACATLGLPAALTKFLSGEASSSREAAWGTIRRAVRTVLVTSAAARITRKEVSSHSSSWALSSLPPALPSSSSAMHFRD